MLNHACSIDIANTCDLLGREEKSQLCDSGSSLFATEGAGESSGDLILGTKFPAPNLLSDVCPNVFEPSSLLITVHISLMLSMGRKGGVDNN